jgi:hypothetical protein
MDGMLEHDGQVGNLLKALDDLGIANPKLPGIFGVSH